MLIKFNQDINTKQTVYVICDNAGNAKTITTNICTAIVKVQAKAEKVK